MIARVKIAPFERWCEPIKSVSDGGYPPGMTVEIRTESMCINPHHGCRGRLWELTEKSAEETVANGADRVGCSAMCEHMLEMD